MCYQTINIVYNFKPAKCHEKNKIKHEYIYKKNFSLQTLSLLLLTLFLWKFVNYFHHYHYLFQWNQLLSVCFLENIGLKKKIYIVSKFKDA